MSANDRHAQFNEAAVKLFKRIRSTKAAGYTLSAATAGKLHISVELMMDMAQYLKHTGYIFMQTENRAKDPKKVLMHVVARATDQGIEWDDEDLQPNMVGWVDESKWQMPDPYFISPEAVDAAIEGQQAQMNEAEREAQQTLDAVAQKVQDVKDGLQELGAAAKTAGQMHDGLEWVKLTENEEKAFISIRFDIENGKTPAQILQGLWDQMGHRKADQALMALRKQGIVSYDVDTVELTEVGQRAKLDNLYSTLTWEPVESTEEAKAAKADAIAAKIPALPPAKVDPWLGAPKRDLPKAVRRSPAPAKDVMPPTTRGLVHLDKLQGELYEFVKALPGAKWATAEELIERFKNYSEDKVTHAIQALIVVNFLNVEQGATLVKITLGHNGQIGRIIGRNGRGITLSLETKPTDEAKPTGKSMAKKALEGVVKDKAPRVKKERTVKMCRCGCGGETYSNFVPGHDAKAKKLLTMALKDEGIAQTVPDILKTYASSDEAPAFWHALVAPLL